MFRFIVFIIVAVVFIELYTLVAVASLVGAFGAITLALGTAIVGLNILSTQGKRQMQKIKAAVTTGQNPQQVIAEGVWMLICGLVLLMPGLLTDAIGVLLLIPIVRFWLVKRGYAPKFNVPFSNFNQQNQSDDDIVEGEFYEEVPKASHLKDDSK
ncbi:MAG: FxsA family protein [Saccharospirillaceae bacterium]|nr:FxsA family protein [Pseudomonadales bacterium]NRB78867.1 FxsA family protein [Saccharospirillaceae bacterium]